MSNKTTFTPEQLQAQEQAERERNGEIFREKASRRTARAKALMQEQVFTNERVEHNLPEANRQLAWAVYEFLQALAVHGQERLTTYHNYGVTRVARVTIELVDAPKESYQRIETQVEVKENGEVTGYRALDGYFNGIFHQDI